jgi:hypothetical protein
LLPEVAHNWRGTLDLQRFHLDHRLREPALTGAIKGQRRAPVQPVFDFCDRYEPQPATPNPPELRSDVLIEEVPIAAKRLRRLSRRQCQAQLVGNVIWLTHRLLLSSGGNVSSLSREYQIVRTAASDTARSDESRD